MDKTVVIVGLGGLGGYVCEYLSRLNFKKIILIDGDKFDETNMNRQLLCSKETLGSFKVDCYAKRIKEVSNSDVIIYKEYLKDDNIDIINDCDLVFSCLDNIQSRLLLEKACNQKNIPLVNGSVGENFGNVCLCLQHGILKKVYKNKEEIRLFTNSYTVSTIAALQVKIAIDYFNNNYENIKNKLLYVDLDDYEIKHLSIK